MLQILQHSGIGEICVVVTRWFGGVKLGTGGLVRAYQDAVRMNLELLPLTERMDMTDISLAIDYTHVDALQRLLPTYKGRIIQEEYGVKATFTLSLPMEQSTEFRASVTALTNGAVNWL